MSIDLHEKVDTVRKTLNWAGIFPGNAAVYCMSPTEQLVRVDIEPGTGERFAKAWAIVEAGIPTDVGLELCEMGEARTHSRRFVSVGASVRRAAKDTDYMAGVVASVCGGSGQSVRSAEDWDKLNVEIRPSDVATDKIATSAVTYADIAPGADNCRILGRACGKNSGEAEEVTLADFVDEPTIVDGNRYGC